MMKKSILTVMILCLCLVFANYASAECPSDDGQATNGTVNQVVADVDKTEALQHDSDQPVTISVEKGFEDVQGVFDQFMIGYLNRDLDKVLDTMADNDHVFFIGSGSTTILVGKEDIKQAFEHDFNRINHFDVNVPWLYIYGNGNAAWLNAIILASYDSGDEKNVIDSRLTLVFEKIDDKWKIISLHFSLPAAKPQKESVEVEDVRIEEDSEE